MQKTKEAGQKLAVRSIVNQVHLGCGIASLSFSLKGQITKIGITLAKPGFRPRTRTFTGSIVTGGFLGVLEKPMTSRP
jgi:hypothetical protein